VVASCRIVCTLRAMNITLTNDELVKAIGDFLVKNKKVDRDGQIKVFVQVMTDALPTVRVEFTPK